LAEICESWVTAKKYFMKCCGRCYVEVSIKGRNVQIYPWWIIDVKKERI
jgi:hypothetical protein